MGDQPADAARPIGLQFGRQLVGREIHEVEGVQAGHGHLRVWKFAGMVWPPDAAMTWKRSRPMRWAQTARSYPPAMPPLPCRLTRMRAGCPRADRMPARRDRKSTRLNSSH